MSTRAIRRALQVLPVLAILVFASCGDRGRGGEVLATAEDFRLTVDEAAELLASTDDLPNSPEVVSALGELWMDYTLLGLAFARDPDLERLDLDPLLSQRLEQELVYRLRDEVVEVDTVVSEEELREAFEEERPGEEVRARHILLSVPADAGEAERDSIREQAESLRQRIAAGESFEDLAREYSDDPGSAESGGDLGFFGRGMMVPAFEEAAFALDAGELGEVVESPFGLHVIRVEERRTPTFEESAEDLREEIRMERTLQAESLYVAGLEEPANIEVTEDAFGTVRQIAGNPNGRLTGREAGQALTTYDGGEFTAADFREFVAGQPQGILERIASAPDEQLEGMLRNLTRVELLRSEARELGITVPEEEERRIREDLLENYREAAELLGLADIEASDGESREEAVQRRVRELIEEILAGQRNVIPMAELGIPLRRQFGGDLRTDAIPQVLERVGELRGNGAQPPAPEGAPQEGVPPQMPPGGGEGDPAGTAGGPDGAPDGPGRF